MRFSRSFLSTVLVWSCHMVFVGCIDDSAEEQRNSAPMSGGTADSILCVYEGENYAVGEQFRAGDGCNSCFCEDDGSVSCTEKACADTMAACTPECGPAPGAPQRLCPDGVNYEGPGECARLPDGMCGYPMKACPNIIARPDPDDMYTGGMWTCARSTPVFVSRWGELWRSWAVSAPREWNVWTSHAIVPTWTTPNGRPVRRHALRDRV